MGIYIYIHNAGISPTHMSYSQDIILLYLLLIKKNQANNNPGEEIEERGGERRPERKPGKPQARIITAARRWNVLPSCWARQ